MNSSDELLKVAEALADNRLSEADLDGAMSAPFLALQRIARAFRTGGSQAAEEAEEFEFKWRHLLVKEKIGQGGFGNVYRAYDPILRRNVALKLSRRSHSAAEAAMIAEARLMARLRHPAILAIHGADTDNESAGIWCDLLSGQTLDAVLDVHSRWSAEEALAITAPLASAIEAIHDNGLTHGDIKPANIMITGNGAPVLMDFGAGRELSKSWKSGAGSPLLMAPEQFDTLETSSASDVYAFGAVLYRVLCGRYPIEASSLDELEEIHKSGRSPNWSLVNGRFRPLLKRMLHRLPNERPSAAEFGEKIRALVSAPQRRRRRIAVAVIISSLAVGLILATDGTRRAQRAEQQALEEKGAAQAALDFLQHLLMSPTGINQGANVRMLDALDMAHSRLRASPPDSPFVRAKVEQTLGLTYQNLDEYEKARELLESALHWYLQSSPECCEDKAETRIALAENSLSRADVDGAFEQLELAESALDASAVELPRQRIRLLKVRADARSELGESAQAQALLQQALDLTEENAGTAGELRADLQSEMAWTLMQMSDFDAAESMARESLYWFENSLGNADFRTVKPRHMTSTIVLLRGDFVESERLSRINLGILEELEPEASSDRIGILINILDVLNQTGRFDEALELANEIYTLAEGLHGPAHRRTLQARANVGVTLTSLGRYAEAATVFRENWSAEREAIGEYALDTLVSRGNLAEALLFAGEVREAEEVATGAHAANVEALGADHFATLYFADILALSKLRLGDTEAAVAFLEANLADKQRALGEDNRMTWDTVGYLAEALLADGQADRALSLADALVDYRSAQHGDSHPKTTEARALLEQAQQVSGL